MPTMPHWPDPNWRTRLSKGEYKAETMLEQTHQFLKLVGNPERALPPVIHVAGTNGKGSTIAIMASILKAAGLRAHSFTSPHLHSYTARVVINHAPIPEKDFFPILEQCRHVAEEHKINVSFFEGMTIAAFLAFSTFPADVILLETGMGGRLDCTNVVPNTAVTVLTPISYDHTEYLGPTLTTIASEKCGIMRENTPCIVAHQPEEAERAIHFHAEKKKAPLVAHGYDWGVTKTADGMLYRAEDTEWELPRPALLGDHQIMNAGTAISALRALKSLTITHDHVSEGLKKVTWAGRLQPINSGPVHHDFPDLEIWVDGAHNPAGAHTLAVWASDQSPKPLILICGFTKGRDVGAYLEAFRELQPTIYTVRVEAEPMSQSAGDVAEQATKAGFNATTMPSWQEALYHSKQTGARVIVCGSLYLIAHVLEHNNMVG